MGYSKTKNIQLKRLKINPNSFGEMFSGIQKRLRKRTRDNVKFS